MKYLYLSLFLVTLFLAITSDAQSPSFAGLKDPRVKKVLPKIASDGKVIKRATTDVAHYDLKVQYVKFMKRHRI